MVIDTSALVAILLDEPPRRALAEAIANDPRRLLSGASLLEATLVIEARHGDAGGRELDLLVHRAAIAVVDVTAAQIEAARAAWRSYGKGRHHAALNFVDMGRPLTERLGARPRGRDRAGIRSTPNHPVRIGRRWNRRA